MVAQVVLSVTQGKLAGQRYVYDSRTVCVVGRHADCHIRLPSDAENVHVSRYHCLFDINPPDVRVRDLGSGNGTFVNGQKIGQRSSVQLFPEIGSSSNEYDLLDGDQIQIGYTVLTVEIVEGTDLSIVEGKSATIPPQDPFQAVQSLLESVVGDRQDLANIKNYKVIKPLGVGKCGAVYLAQHDLTQELVALKVMLPQAAVHDRAVKMFIREMSNTKALQHPNVVKLLDYGEFNGIFFFTMECCHEGNVADFMKTQGGKLPLKIAISITLQILSGLEYTHAAVLPAVRLSDGSIGEGQGLVHRDLKPANIFLRREGKKTIAKLGDYGLAKAFELAGLSGQTLTGKRGVMGTPSFMSRQQMLNTKYVQPSVDIWAAAACLYNMLTGEVPRDFGSEDPLQVILKKQAVPILHRNPFLPKALAAVIDRALWEDPHNHHEIYYKNASDFRKALVGAVTELM